MEDVALKPVRKGFVESNSKEQHSSDLNLKLKTDTDFSLL